MPTLPSVSIRSLLMLVLLLLLAGSSVAQTRAKLERANRLLKERAFVDASKLYLEILDRHEVSEAKLNLAECYRLMGSSIEAEYWFGQSIQLSEAKPIDKLHYGMALQSNNKCEQAKRWFDEYARLNPDDLRGQMLSKACGTAVLNELLSKNTELFDVASMATINSNYRDYAPFIYKNGIAFVSERDKGIVDEKINAETNAPFSKLYYIAIDGVGDTARVAGKRYTRPIKLNELNSSLHDGPMSVTADGKMAILTRTNLYGRNDVGIRKNKIYWVVSLGGGHWSEPKTFAFNSDEYSTMHPAISPDGKVIYFASDMPGGFGGYDLYKTNYEDGRWSPPINLGPEINTEGNEGYPFVHASGDLYFSSNGRIGMGGQDVYVVKLGAEGTGEIINMGYPINSPSDDISFVMNANKTRGFFASNRNGDVSSDDIFSFTRTAVNVELLVVDKETGKAIGGARVMCECGTKSQNADAQGNYSIELPSSRNCEFIAGRDGYKSSSKVALTKGKAPGSTLHLKIELETERRREVLLTGVARTRDEQPIPNTQMLLFSARGELLDSLQSNAKGEYRFTIREGEEYWLKAKQEGYLVSSQTFRTDAKDSKMQLNSTLALFPTSIVDAKRLPNNVKPANESATKPTAPVVINNSSDPTKANNEHVASNIVKKATPEIKRTTILLVKNIYYETGKFDIVGEQSKTSLLRIYNFMKDNPTLIVEIGSHTDSRGKAKDNEALSYKRAKAVVDFLAKQGIPRERMLAKGYGESQLLNQCADRVKCSEEDHRRNRRTEFKLIGTVDGVRFEQSSTEPDRISLD